MNEIEQKALALVNQVAFERNNHRYASLARAGNTKVEALCRAIEQHEAFKQEVSDRARRVVSGFSAGHWVRSNLEEFIIPKPKPDPLVEVMKEWFGMKAGTNEDHANDLRAALEARGLEIRSKNDD
jgi:hypothetical protein